MRTQVNPGSLLELTGSFELDRDFGKVLDRESGAEVTLDGLLRSFLEDPEETITGPIRIRIEAGLQPRSRYEVTLAAFTEDDPAGLWKKGDAVADLGPEGEGSPVHSFLHLGRNELLGLSDPYERGLLSLIDRESM